MQGAVCLLTLQLSLIVALLLSSFESILLEIVAVLRNIILTCHKQALWFSN